MAVSRPITYKLSLCPAPPNLSWPRTIQYLQPPRLITLLEPKFWPLISHQYRRRCCVLCTALWRRRATSPLQGPLALRVDTKFENRCAGDDDDDAKERRKSSFKPQRKKKKRRKEKWWLGRSLYREKKD